MEIELTKIFENREEPTVLSMEGFQEMTPHPDGGTTLTFQRANSAHKIPDLLKQRDLAGDTPENRALSKAAGAMLRGRRDWLQQPSLERVRVAEDVSTVQQRLSAQASP